LAPVFIRLRVDIIDMTDRNLPAGSKPINVMCERCGHNHDIFTTVKIVGYIKRQPIPDHSIVGKRPLNCEKCGYTLKYPEFLD